MYALTAAAIVLVQATIAVVHAAIAVHSVEVHADHAAALSAVEAMEFHVVDHLAVAHVEDHTVEVHTEADVEVADKIKNESFVKK